MDIAARIPVPSLPAAAAAAVAFVVVAGGWMWLGLGGETAVVWVDDLATLLAVLAATLGCAHAGRLHDGRMRGFWWLLAAGCGALTVGELLWAGYDLVLRREVPVPSWADAAYLASVPPIAAALLSHPGMRGGSERARDLLDGLVTASALAFLGWTLVLGDLWRHADMSHLAGLVTFAYPFTDVVMVFLVVLVVRRMTGRSRLDLWCLLGGLLALALTDAGYAYLREVQDYEAGQMIDLGWIVAYLAIALAALRGASDPAPRPAAEPSRRSPAAVLVPFVPMLTALTVAGAQARAGERLDRVGWSIACALVLLVLARQTLLVVELARPSAREAAAMPERLVAALGGVAPGEPTGREERA